jgi:hypothetical protein
VRRPTVLAPAECSLLRSRSTTLAAIFCCTRPIACKRLFLSRFISLHKGLSIGCYCSLICVACMGLSERHHAHGALARGEWPRLARGRSSPLEPAVAGVQTALHVPHLHQALHMYITHKVHFPGACPTTGKQKPLCGRPRKRAPFITKAWRKTSLQDLYLLLVRSGACGQCTPWLQHVSRFRIVTKYVGLPVHCKVW